MGIKDELRSGFISASFQVLLGGLAKFALEEIGKIWGVDAELRKLERALSRIQAMIEYVEHDHWNNFCSNSSKKAWQLWLEDVKTLSNVADDLLEEISLEMDLAKSKVDCYQTSSGNLVRNEILSSGRLDVPREISKLGKDLEDLACEMDKFFTFESLKFESTKVTSLVKSYSYSATRSSSFVDHSLIVGREIQKADIVQRLLSDTNVVSSNLSLIPIVGMAGIGKTTLAQVVYNDEQVLKYFDLRIWASVSLEFDVLRVTRSIIESVTKKSCTLINLDPLQAKLQELLNGKRFLLVLDDLWSEKYNDWQVLSAPLRFGSKGSKIIITTRSRGVSSLVGSHSYLLPFLHDKDCWELMKKRALLNKNICTDESVDALGLKIAKKCKGLPLMANILGSTMNCIPFEEWDAILKSNLWDLTPLKDDIFPALALSYHYLPTELKKCFAYCALFPANYKFEDDNLVLIWMAEGFIQPMGERRLEDIGKQYFKDLLWRSFFYSDPVNKKIYKMHDLLHRMAQFISTDVCLQMEDERPSCYPSLINIRHLAFHCNNLLLAELKEFPKCKRLRTFLLTCNNGGHVGQGTFYLFQKFSMLRVLDLSQGGITELPDLVGCLKHLRYLNLSGNPIKFIPNSIGKLSYLQTLKLINCRELLGFPCSLRNLGSLRHLQFDKNRRITHMPPGFGELKNLQTLSAFVVGQDEGYTIMELKKMAFLRGSLHLLRLENVKDEIEAEEAKLEMKPWLQELELEWTTPTNKHDAQIVLSHIRFHGNLNKLVITNYCGEAFPSRWLNDSTRSKLKTMHLHSCRECSLLPVLGHLPFLESLRIEDMPALKHVHFEFSVGFPSLKSLELRNMPELKEWEGLRDGDMSSLDVLICKDCPCLMRLPSLHILSSLTVLKIKRCPMLQSLPERMPVTLQKLDVRGSTTVEERCEEGGEDWLKMRSISALKIVSDRSCMNEPTPMEL